MLAIIGTILIFSGAACIIFDLGMKAAKKPEEPKEEPEAEQHKE